MCSPPLHQQLTDPLPPVPRDSFVGFNLPLPVLMLGRTGLQHIMLSTNFIALEKGHGDAAKMPKFPTIHPVKFTVPIFSFLILPSLPSQLSTKHKRTMSPSHVARWNFLVFFCGNIFGCVGFTGKKMAPRQNTPPRSQEPGAPNPLLTRDKKNVPPVGKAPKSLTKQRCVGHSSTLPQVWGGGNGKWEMGGNKAFLKRLDPNGSRVSLGPTRQSPDLPISTLKESAFDF